MFYIYILYSPAADSYYIGHTNELERRVREHNELSEGKYTCRHRPWELKVSFEVGNKRGLARKIENHIKRQKSRTYIESLIERGSIDELINRYTVG